jgi:hypothetical protein
LQESVKRAHKNAIVTLLGTRITSSGAVRVLHSKHASLHPNASSLSRRHKLGALASLSLYARSSCSRKKIVSVVFVHRARGGERFTNAIVITSAASFSRNLTLRRAECGVHAS